MTTQHFIQRGQISMTTLCARIATTKKREQDFNEQFLFLGLNFIRCNFNFFDRTGKINWKYF
jgi:hypothetical protein